MKVFVTGHKGYIGVHLVDLLKQSGHTVTGCDLGIFDGCAWEKTVPADRDLRKDVRDITLQDLDVYKRQVPDRSVARGSRWVDSARIVGESRIVVSRSFTPNCRPISANNLAAASDVPPSAK